MRYIFIDAGASMGDSIEGFMTGRGQYAKHLKPRDNAASYEVYAFEPVACLTELREVARKYAPRVHVITKALWNADGELAMRSDGHDGASCLAQYDINHMNMPLTAPVRTVRVSDWLREHFTYEDYIVLKLDIEGSEYAVLRDLVATGLDSWLRELYVEYHRNGANLPVETEIQDLDKHFRELPNLIYYDNNWP